MTTNGSHRVEYTNQANRDMQRIAAADGRRVYNAIERYATTDHGDVRKLQGYVNEWRLRVGRFRVIFTFTDDGDTMLILRVLPRGRAYRR